MESDVKKQIVCYHGVNHNSFKADFPFIKLKMKSCIKSDY